MSDSRKYSVPEGGWRGWLTVFATFMVHFLQNGFRDSFGLLLPSIRKVFQVEHAQAAMTNSIMMFLILCSSPMAACMIKKRGHRMTMIIGVFISSLGLLIAGGYIHLSSIHKTPPNILVLHLTVGVMVGLGFGLIYLPSIDILKLYFDRKLGLANGIGAAGSGLGQFVMAPLINMVEAKCGLSGLMYVLAATVCLSVVFCFAYPAHNVQGDVCHYQPLSEKGNLKEASLATALMNVWKNPPMAVMIVHVFFVSLGHYSVLTFFADRARSFGISRDNSTLLLSIMGFSSAVVRIVFGVLIDKFRSKLFLMMTVMLSINGVSMLSSQFLHGFGGQALTSAVFGAGLGAYVTSLIVLVSAIVDDITFPMSICVFTIGVATLVGPTSVGFLLDVSGSYLPGLFSSGVIFMMGAFCLPLVWLKLPRERKCY